MTILTNKTYSLTIPKNQSGRFFIGDLGYTQTDNEVWRDKYVRLMFHGNKAGNEGVFAVDGYNFFVANTGGDGVFPVICDTEDSLPTKQQQEDYINQHPDDVGFACVDAGCLGVIPMELVTEDEENLVDRGLIIDLGLEGDVDELPIEFVSGDYFYFAGVQVILDINYEN